MLYYQLEHLHFRVSPAAVWTDYPSRDDLDRLYQRVIATDAGRLGANPSFDSFARLILTWYFDQLDDGRIEKACTDIVKLWTGYTVAEVRAIAAATYQHETESPLAGRSLGGRSLPLGIRFLREPCGLLARLQELSFEIWVISGSNAWSVEPVAERLGIPRDRVIGIELTETGGILTATERRPVPVMSGKVEALRVREPRRPLLVVSDSRHDRPLLAYSSELKILVNSGENSSDAFFPRRQLSAERNWAFIESPTIEH